jgi:hypothetical protein
MRVLDEHGIDDSGVHLATGGGSSVESGDTARVQELEEMLRLQNENWKRLFSMAEELSEELAVTKELVEQREHEISDLKRALGWD